MFVRVRQALVGGFVMTEPHIPNFDYEGFAKRLAEAFWPEKPTAFAARVGVPHPTLSKYLKGQGVSPRLDVAAVLAKGANVTLEWLIWGQGDGPNAEAIVKIPRYDALLAAGAGSWNEGRRKLDEIPYTSSFLAKRLGRSSALGLSVLESAGDSMFPTIPDGSLVLIDEQDQRLVDAVFAFVLEGEARIKRFRRLTDGVMIISDNKLYEPEKLTGDELNKLQIIGRCRWVGHVL